MKLTAERLRDVIGKEETYSGRPAVLVLLSPEDFTLSHTFEFHTKHLRNIGIPVSVCRDLTKSVVVFKSGQSFSFTLESSNDHP